MEYTIPWYHCPILVVDHHHYVLPSRILTAQELIHSKQYTEVHVLHIDQHSDLHENPYDIETSLLNDHKALEEFADEYCTVGNFIEPILRTGIISHVEQIRTEWKLLNTDREEFLEETPWRAYILDIDLDYRAPEMSISDIPTSYHQTSLISKYASLITIATSPWFIHQDRASEILKDLTNHWSL
jgi:hypothetical protein